MQDETDRTNASASIEDTEAKNWPTLQGLDNATAQRLVLLETLIQDKNAKLAFWRFMDAAFDWMGEYDRLPERRSLIGTDPCAPEKMRSIAEMQLNFLRAIMETDSLDLVRRANELLLRGDKLPDIIDSLSFSLERQIDEDDDISCEMMTSQ